jgi:hypothetical protein
VTKNDRNLNDIKTATKIREKMKLRNSNSVMSSFKLLNVENTPGPGNYTNKTEFGVREFR